MPGAGQGFLPTVRTVEQGHTERPGCTNALIVLGGRKAP